MAKEQTAQFGGLTFEQVQTLMGNGMTLENIERVANAGFTFDQIERLSIAAPAPAPAVSNLGLTKADMAELMDAQRKAINPSNPTHPGISAFNTKGEREHPKPRLDRETYFCGHRQSEEQLTPEEVEAYNELTESCSIPEKGEFCYVRVTPKQRLVVVPAATRDQMQDLPNSLVLVLKEFKYGAKAIDPVELAKQLKEAQDRIADLEERLVS